MLLLIMMGFGLSFSRFAVSFCGFGWVRFWECGQGGLVGWLVDWLVGW